MKKIKAYLDSFVRSRIFPLYVTSCSLLLAPNMAHAKISDWAGNIGSEVAIIVGWIVLILGAFGIALSGFGVISAVFAKKNREPLSYQSWFIFGGVVCVLLIPLVIGLGSSISGADPSNTVNGLLEQP